MTTLSEQMHVVIAERHDHVVGALWTRHPRELLSILAGATLGRVCTCARAATPRGWCAASPSASSTSITAKSMDSFWTVADFEEVVAALGEYDLERGVRIESAGMRINDEVHVTGWGRAIVTGFADSGHVTVRLTHPGANAYGAVAPRSLVKPVIRAGTL
jgi:hypothetical protein